MALRKYRFPVAVVVPDPTKSAPEVRDPETFRLIAPAKHGSRIAPPGEEVEIDEVEAAKIIARHGQYKQPAPPQTGPKVIRLGLPQATIDERAGDREPIDAGRRRFTS